MDESRRAGAEICIGLTCETDVMPDRQFSDQRLADLYDLGNAGSEDRDYYLKLPGTPPQDILDLGCGTGLLCHAYAARGHRVVGVDPSEAMLRVAQRGALANKVIWQRETAEAFRSDRRFDLITMTGHAFQVLLTDTQVAAMLNRAANHLKPDGRLVFESRNPAIDWDRIWARDYEMNTQAGPVRAARRMTDTWRAPEYLSFAWDYDFQDGRITSESTLRFMTSDRIQSIAAEAGLELVLLHGDWESGPFVSSVSREMIFHFTSASAKT